MQYKVTRQYARGSDSLFAQFAEMNDAIMFIEEKLKADAALNVKVTYRIVEFNDVIKEFTPEDIQAASGASGAKSTATFTPTPFNTTARPPGTPPKWFKDEDETKK